MAGQNNNIEPVPANGDAVRAIEALATKAAGKLTHTTILPPAGAVGLPEKVHVLLEEGEDAQIISLHSALEEWRTLPERRKGVAKVTTLRALIDLASRHKDEHSALFARTLWPEPSLTAIINYHQTDKVARHGDHRVHYAFPLTPEFQRWIAKNGKEMDQVTFAEFIEDNIMDLSVAMDGEVETYEKLFRAKFAVPTDLIELARGLEINVDSRVKTIVKLQTGEAQIAFDTEHKNASGEALHVPGLFMLSLPVFIDGSQVRLPARLRYRAREGKIGWTYLLYKWEDALRDRVVADAAIAATQSGLPIFEGAPEA